MIDRYDVYAYHDAWGDEGGDYGAYSWTEDETQPDGEWVKAYDALELVKRIEELEALVAKLQGESK